MRLVIEWPDEKDGDVSAAVMAVYGLGVEEHIYKHLQETVEGCQRDSAARLCESLDATWGNLTAPVK